MDLKNLGIQTRQVNTVIVGSGAAAYNAANRLWEKGVRDLLMVTENRLAGTSRNTGSDKQTYYKLSLGGSEPDSVAAMAQALYAGNCVDGEICLAEAANSARSFLNLVEQGVPFPFDESGAFFGYQTDHDNTERATSVGPLSSKAMTEKLEETARSRGIEQLNKCLVVKLLTYEGKLYGMLGFLHGEADLENPAKSFILIRCSNLIYATGGPAGIYKNSVYPAGQYGMSGIAFEAGVKGRNLTEWQYGLASVKPRWNVSGTYMQALPRFISTDKDGKDPQEFLPAYFSERREELRRIFLKGYQWPFDVCKIKDGSSVIDLLVYKETALKGRRVFLDFTENPRLKAIETESLDGDDRTYLEKNAAIFGKPIERLRKMNEPAYQFFLGKGVDLARESLEIALCAQHNNGGLAVDDWWRTNIQGFYACGEVAGTHGVYRPGGSALNSGQVGSLRAALDIAKTKRQYNNEIPETVFEEVDNAVSKAAGFVGEIENCRDLWEAMSGEFSEVAGPIRDQGKVSQFLAKVEAVLADFDRKVRVSSFSNLFYLYHFRDALLSQRLYGQAMLDYFAKGGRSRGSALYINPQGKTRLDALWPGLRFDLDNGDLNEQIQEIAIKDNQMVVEWRQRHPLTIKETAFETAWKTFRQEYGLEL
jgi:succinate dehydrogenase / fumarate reductase flavoprotein subunit